MRLVQSRGRHRQHLGKRRRVLEPPQLDLRLIKVLIILPRGLKYRLVLRCEGLDDRPPGLAASPASADDLSQQREGALTRAEAPGVKALVGAYHAHKGDVLKVQPLGHHLCADHDRDLFISEPLEQRLMRARGGHGIGIEPYDLRVREKLIQLRLYHLRARADVLEFSPAFGAAVVQPLRISAVVAHEPPVRAVIGQRNAAPRALIGIPAFAAAYKLVRPAAVYEQYALLAAADVLAELLAQLFAYVRAVAAPKLALHIDDLHLRQLHIVISAPQREERIIPLPCLIHAHDVRRRRTEQQQAARLRAAIYGNIPRVVAWAVLRFIGFLLLLVDDDKPKLIRRGKHRAARADHEPCLTGADALEFVITLPDRKAAVQHSDGIAEVRGKGLYHLRRQSDLRHQQYHRAPACELLGYEMDVNARFSAPGHAEEQRGSALAGHGKGVYAVKRFLLLVIENGQRFDIAEVYLRTPEGLFLIQLDKACFAQRGQRLP